jgi:hypothetical protein
MDWGVSCRWSERRRRGSDRWSTISGAPVSEGVPRSDGWDHHRRRWEIYRPVLGSIP